MMFVCGCMMGGILDVYRVISGQVRLARWLVPLFDVLYWLAAMIIVFRTLYVANLGEVRIFIFLGLLAGIVVYYILLSRTFIRLVRLLLRWIIATCQTVVRMFRLLVITPLVFIYRILLAIFMFFGTASIFLCKIVLQLVYPLWKLIYRPLIALMKRLRLDAAFRWLQARFTRSRRDK